MEDRGMRTETKPTGKSAMGLVAIGVLIVVLAVAVIWAVSQPGFMEELVNVLLLAIVAIVIIAIVAYIAYGILAIGYYATKGEVVQTGVSHSVDDIAGVEGRTIDEDGNDTLGKED
ncbi:MAG: hypothetical protein Q4Q58_02485 [Thermoplasmata archaeon]|nr:hypothetical protein [Thermoplasmata archaeon]